MQPLLSIVIPTRERADTLQEALVALTSLKMANVEILVCDNASTDNTRQVVENIPDPRIKYFRSEVRLSMPENFERGLRLASGQYVITMGDDDFLIEENLQLALSKAQRDELDLVYWFRGCFYWGSYPDPGLASTFSIPEGRGHYPVNAMTLLNLSYLGVINYYYLPGIYNSLCSRTFLQKYLALLRGKYFPEYVIAVDVFSALVFSSMSPSVCYQQSPASVSGISKHSNGMSLYNGGAEAARFIQELGRKENSFVMPESFIGSVTPIAGPGMNDLQILVDYFNVATHLLNYTLASPPDMRYFAGIQLRRMLVKGAIEIDVNSDLYRQHIQAIENASVVQEDLATYFFRLWSIPLPKVYAGRFESNVATVRHMVANLLAIGFNRAVEVSGTAGQC